MIMLTSGGEVDGADDLVCSFPRGFLYSCEVGVLLCFPFRISLLVRRAVMSDLSTH